MKDPLARYKLKLELSLVAVSLGGAALCYWGFQEGRFFTAWLGFSFTTTLLGVAWSHIKDPLSARALRLYEGLAARRMRLARIQELSDDALLLVVEVSKRGLVCELDDLRRLLGADDDKTVDALLDSLQALVDCGLLGLHKFEGQPRYEARPAAGDRALLELERRERRWLDPGPKIGPRSRPSSFAERLA